MLQLAKALGIAKVVGAIHAVAAQIAEVQAILNALAGLPCVKSLVNQKDVKDVNLLMARTIQELNVVAALPGNVFDNLVVRPAASISTALTAVPSIVATVPPALYVQKYGTDDPYPGYIQWVDPNGDGQPTYTPRNGQPNYVSATQHTQFATQDHFNSVVADQIATGSLTPQSLTAAFLSTQGFAQTFSAAATLGSAFPIVGAAAVALLFAPRIGRAIDSVFNPKVAQAKAVSGPTQQKAVDKYTVNQTLLHKKRQSMRVALDASGGLSA